VTSIGQRWTNQPMMSNGARAGSVHSSAYGSDLPFGSRTSTQRIGNFPLALIWLLSPVAGLRLMRASKPLPRQSLRLL
jgi:hypothetical protein